MVFSEPFFRFSIDDSDPEWMEWMTTTFPKKKMGNGYSKIDDRWRDGDGKGNGDGDGNGAGG